MRGVTINLDYHYTWDFFKDPVLIELEKADDVAALVAYNKKFSLTLIKNAFAASAPPNGTTQNVAVEQASILRQFISVVASDTAIEVTLSENDHERVKKAIKKAQWKGLAPEVIWESSAFYKYVTELKSEELDNKIQAVS